MKRKYRLISELSEERILQLSNDISENIRSGNVADWRAVAMYWRRKCDEAIHSTASLRMSISALTIADKMREVAQQEIIGHLKRFERR